MSEVARVIDLYRFQPDIMPSSDQPFTLRCSIEPPAPAESISSVWGAQSPPGEVVELWRCTREAWLFRDVEYGQWGLHLLQPEASFRRTRFAQATRAEDFVADDIVLGEFLGDQELLVVAPSEPSHRRVLVALPLDERHEWHVAAASLAAFLERFLASAGSKFWETGA